MALNDIHQAIPLLRAEQEFRLAGSAERVLRQQVSRAAILADLSRLDEAADVQCRVVEQCEGIPACDALCGQVLIPLGGIEQKQENRPAALKYLEAGYRLSLAAGARQQALSALRMLQSIYTYSIPDAQKRAYW